MGEGKVVSLTGEASPRAGEVNPEVIEDLERLLSAAHSGDLQGLVAVGYHADDCCSRWRVGVTNGLKPIGALQVLSSEMISDHLGDD